MTVEVNASEARQSAAVREPAPVDGYSRDIARGLDRAFESAETELQRIELDEARLIVFSDHHRGSRDGADDFLRCEQAYQAALGYYLEAGHRLFAVGDVDELWECPPQAVLDAYGDTLALEAEFHRAGRLERFWGNHDDGWRSADDVKKLLGGFPELRIREALKVEVHDRGRPTGLLFFVHGHQGTRESDRFAWFSKAVVRHVWRPLQRRLSMASTTPAKDFALRQRHDVAMFGWASQRPERPVLVAGHTHRPVFWTSTPPEEERSEQKLERELEQLRTEQAAPEKLGEVRARLEYSRAETRRADRAALSIDPPCYFNSGCCSFGDGDITGLEIVGGEIRLVRWPDDDGEPQAKILAKADLREVLAVVSAGSSGEHVRDGGG